MNRKFFIKLIVMVVIALLIILYATTALAIPAPTTLVPRPTPTNVGVDDMVGKVLGGVQAAGAIAAVIVVIVIGIMFLLASPEGKMELKGKVVPYLIGITLLFAVTTIVLMFYKMFSGNG